MPQKHRPGALRHVWIAVLTAFVVLLVAPWCAAKPHFVEVAVDGVINPLRARLVARAVQRAENEGAEFLLVTIDTPGGLVVSMQQIVSSLTNTRVPVIGFVAPRSAQASSAGAFVLLACDVAAMAPGTRVGAAHPIAQGKPLEGVLDQKATNALSALMKSLAERRNRPAALAEAMVRESTSYTAEEAHEKKLVELIAVNREDLFRQLAGYEVRAGRKLSTQGLTGESVGLSRFERLLDQLADPTLASLLLSLGTLAIVYELSAPGIGVGGVLGAVLIVLGLLGSSVLAFETTALLLLVIGMVAVGLEALFPAHGVLALTGIAALVVGALLMVDTDSYFGGATRVKIGVFAPVLVIAAVGLLVVARAARRALRAPAQTGTEALIGKRGDARSTFGSAAPEREGFVFVDGARWRAETDEERISAGEPIEVLAVLAAPTRLRVRRDAQR